MITNLKTYFEATTIPVFALAQNVRIKSDFKGVVSIVSVDDIKTSETIGDLQSSLPKPIIPESGEKKELFEFRFMNDDDEIEHDLVQFDDSPLSLTGEGTDMEIFGENHVLFWIVPADEALLTKALQDAIDKLLEMEEDMEVAAALFMEDYATRIYFVQHDKNPHELQEILENSFENLMNYISEKHGEDNVLLSELREMI